MNTSTHIYTGPMAQQFMLKLASNLVNNGAEVAYIGKANLDLLRRADVFPPHRDVVDAALDSLAGESQVAVFIPDLDHVADRDFLMDSLDKVKAFADRADYSGVTLHVGVPESVGLTLYGHADIHHVGREMTVTHPDGSVEIFDL